MTDQYEVGTDGANIAAEHFDFTPDGARHLFPHDVNAVAGHVLVSRQLLDGSTLKMTETETGLVVEATLTDVLWDQFAIAYGSPGRFLHPKPIPQTHRDRLRRRLAEWLRGIAGRISEDDSYQWEED